MKSADLLNRQKIKKINRYYIENKLMYVKM